MPVFHSAAYLSDEIDVAFTNGKGTEDTPRLIIYIFIYAVSGHLDRAAGHSAQGGVGRHAQRRRPQVAAPANVMPRSKNGSQRVMPEFGSARQQKASRQGQYDWLTSGHRAAADVQPAGHAGAAGDGPACEPGRKDDAVYMPLLPR